MRLFWQKKVGKYGQLNVSMQRHFECEIPRELFFKLKVNGRAVTSQTGHQPNVEVGSV